MKIMTIVILMLSTLFLEAGPGSENTADTKSVESVKWTINDSIQLIPAYDEYCGFDVVNIWNRKVDLSKSEDTTLIQVLEDTCDFVSPFVGRLTSDFGWRGSRPHYGVDIKLNRGDTVASAFEGMVRISQYSSSYGNVIVVRHKNGLETLYAHLSKRLVSEGAYILEGASIGLGGNTGRSFGDHLHFETRYLGEPINPNDLFNITDTSFTVKSDFAALTPETFAFLKEVRKIKYHRVRSGDSLWRISKRYGVSINKLCSLNGISRKKTLRIGQRVRYN